MKQSQELLAQNKSIIFLDKTTKSCKSWINCYIFLKKI